MRVSHRPGARAGAPCTIGRRTLLAALPALLWGAALRPALAHRSHVTLSRLTSNPRAGTWELVHAIHYHDAARVLALRAPGRGLDPASTEGRARLALEVESSFRVRDPSGSRFPWQMVGAELAGDGVAIYQEVPAPTVRGRFVVESRLLHDIFPDQVNTVSVELARVSMALRLTVASPEGSFVL
jgi:hypothetical protein